MSMERYYETNLRRWNELVDIHAGSEEYDLEDFIAGESSLHTVELEALGDVSGKSLLHLQCHFGLDTLSWARLGARVTGVDFSDTGIELARRIADKIDIDAKFICCNIYDLPEHLNGEFDIVYTSYGVLCWLHDVEGWARIVARYLKPGGTFFMAEFHPFMWVFDDEHPSELHYLTGYWSHDEPEYYESDGSYAAPDAELMNKGTYNWPHPMGEVINALIDAGITVQRIGEYPFSVDDSQMAFMERGEDGYSRLPGLDLPLMYSIKATKMMPTPVF
ncbi:MAG: class I SAM-dependent methyltransferase [Candidatus Bathyarchaeota archaeon]|nr:MAG: class I SAM-dependent methyltransferase [Candidatus Bathyarchaeota archaeon]